MENFIQEGKTLTITNGATAIESGDAVVVGGKLYVAKADIAANVDGELLCEGVVELAKVSGTAFSIGDKLFWDASALNLTKVATGNAPAGVCWEAAGSSAVLAKVKLGDMGDTGIATVIAPIGVTANLSALVPAAASITASNVTVSTPPVKSEIDAGIDALKDKVITALADKADNADVETLRGEIESRLDAIESKVDAVIAAFKASGQMANA